MALVLRAQDHTTGAISTLTARCASFLRRCGAYEPARSSGEPKPGSFLPAQRPRATRYTSISHDIWTLQSPEFSDIVSSRCKALEFWFSMTLRALGDAVARCLRGTQLPVVGQAADGLDAVQKAREVHRLSP